MARADGAGKVSVSYCNPDDPPGRRLLIRLFELASGQPRLNRMYRDYRALGNGSGNFWADAIDRLDLRIRYEADSLSRIPRDGPLVVVANHPYGVLDGLALCYLVSQVRPDFKFLAHATFRKAPELRDHLIPIRFDGGPAAARDNVESRRRGLVHLRDGGAIVIFPAGRVSTAPRIFDRAIDAPWKLFCATMIRRCEATMLPMHFEGQNSWRFHLASRFGEALREALLLGEVARRTGSEVVANIGRPIDFSEVSGLAGKQDLLDFLRGEVYRLAPAR